MKKQFTTLTLSVSMLALFSMPSHAIYNLYKKDGLSFDVNGEINLYLESEDVKEAGQAAILSDVHDELTDERLRLYPEEGASWIDFRGSQELDNDWRVTGTLGLGYAQGNSNGFLNSASVSFDKLNKGAVSFGRQYLHTGFVNRTSTFTPLDVFGEQALRLDWYGTPNLHTSAYYLFPSATDVRNTSNTSKTEGFGASFSYVVPFANNNNLRFAGGYTSSKFNPRSGGAFDKDAYAASVEYQAGRALVAADYGKLDADLKSSLVADSKGDYWGVKVGYEVTPKFNVVAGYGKKETKANYKSGVTAATAERSILNAIYSNGLANTFTSTTTSLMYEKLSQDKLYVRGDYYLRDNVRLYGQYQKEKTQATMYGADYAKLDDDSYRVGVSVSF